MNNFEKVQVRIPFEEVQQVGQSSKCFMFFIRTQDQKRRFITHYFNKHRKLVVGHVLKNHAILTFTGLRRKFYEEKCPAEIKRQLTSSERGTEKDHADEFGPSAEDMVKAFRAGLVTDKNSKCGYCGLECKGGKDDGEFVRFGPMVYHKLCDPRERARLHEEGAAKRARKLEEGPRQIEQSAEDGSLCECANASIGERGEGESRGKEGAGRNARKGDQEG